MGLRFPQTNDDYKGFISFSVSSDKATGAGDVITEAVEGGAGEAVEPEETQAETNEKNAGDETQAQGDVKTPDQNQETEQENQEFEGKNEDQSSNSQASRKVVESGNGVTLYLPVNLGFKDEAQYSEFDMGIRGTAALSAAGGAGQLGGMSGKVFADLGKAGSSFLSGLIGDLAPNSKDLAQLAAVEIAKARPFLPSEAVSAATGITINPNSRVIFRNVGIRKWDLNFKLVPKNPSEANDIHEIIKWFRTELYPEKFGIGDAMYGFKFPNKLDVTIGTGGGWTPPKIKPVYLTNVMTNFNSTSMAMFENGKPVEVDLNISFTEAATLERKDIEAGF